MPVYYFYLISSLSRCVFVDAGVAAIDLETKRKKEEMKAREAQSRAFAEHGELALITVDNPQVATNERIPLRPPMLQVINLVSCLIINILQLVMVACY